MAYLAAFGVLLLLGHLLGLWLDVNRESDPNSIDNQVRGWIVLHRGSWPRLTKLAHFVTQLGNPKIATGAVVGTALGFLVLNHFQIGRIRRSDAGFWLFVAGAGQLLNMGLKAWFQRDRPPFEDRLVSESSYSFPSGHAFFSGVFCVMLAVLVYRELTSLPHPIRPTLAVLVMVISLSVAASRIWLGVHYLSDVITGFALGSLWAGSTIAIRYYGLTRPIKRDDSLDSGHCNSPGKF